MEFCKFPQGEDDNEGIVQSLHQERDGCGVGFLVNINGAASHDLVANTV